MFRRRSRRREDADDQSAAAVAPEATAEAEVAGEAEVAAGEAEVAGEAEAPPPGTLDDARLDEIDARLERLAAELEALAPAAAPTEPPAPAESQIRRVLDEAEAEAERIIEGARARVHAIGGQIDELVRLREELQRSTRALLTEYGAALDRLEAEPESGGQEPFVVEGEVLVDAGPFADLDALRAFQEALASLPGAQEAVVRGFEGRRATLVARLDAPVPLLEELRARGAGPFEVLYADAGRRAVALELP